jgi:hypothetical protein
MDVQSLEKEAAHCREKATEFAGKPEEPFLLRLASAMDELAFVQNRLNSVASACEASVDR